MSLTPAKTDPNYEKETERKRKDPKSFGVGNDKTKEAAKRMEDQRNQR
jgi:hypothetical protein